MVKKKAVVAVRSPRTHYAVNGEIVCGAGDFTNTFWGSLEDFTADESNCPNCYRRLTPDYYLNSMKQVVEKETDTHEKVMEKFIDEIAEEIVYTLSWGTAPVISIGRLHVLKALRWAIENIEKKTMMIDAVRISLDDAAFSALREGVRLNTSSGTMQNVMATSIAEAWVYLWLDSRIFGSSFRRAFEYYSQSVV